MQNSSPGKVLLLEECTGVGETPPPSYLTSCRWTGFLIEIVTKGSNLKQPPDAPLFHAQWPQEQTPEEIPYWGGSQTQEEKALYNMNQTLQPR